MILFISYQQHLLDAFVQHRNWAENQHFVTPFWERRRKRSSSSSSPLGYIPVQTAEQQKSPTYNVKYVESTQCVLGAKEASADHPARREKGSGFLPDSVWLLMNSGSLWLLACRKTNHSVSWRDPDGYATAHRPHVAPLVDNVTSHYITLRIWVNNQSRNTYCTLLN